MRTLLKNKQKLQYALQIAEIPEFEYYEDEDGNKYPVGILPNGKTKVIYDYPTEFYASISMSGGEAEAVEYGLSTAEYSAIAIVERGAVPIKEGALIWHTSEPKFEHIDVNVEIDDMSIILNGEYPIRESADYYIVSIRDSLNFTKIILQAINK